MKVELSSESPTGYPYYYLFLSCLLAQSLDVQEYKSLKHKHLVLTQSHKATESGRHFSCGLLRVFVALCEHVLWLRPKAALGPSVTTRQHRVFQSSIIPRGKSAGDDETVEWWNVGIQPRGSVTR